jgi:hypothetical protein
MQPWWIRSEAGATILEQRDVAPPKPASGQILVRARVRRRSTAASSVGKIVVTPG